jgi:Arc/MetJ family transcription regulator
LSWVWQDQHAKKQVLTDAYQNGILMHMRTTLNIDDHLLKEAATMTGVAEKTSLVRMGLESLIRREAAKRLAAMGGTDHRASAPPRRRRTPKA